MSYVMGFKGQLIEATPLPTPVVKIDHAYSTRTLLAGCYEVQSDLFYCILLVKRLLQQ